MSDLPVRPSGSQTFVRAMGDLILKHPGPLDLAAVKAALDNGDLMNIPDVLKPNGSVHAHTKMSLAVAPSPGSSEGPPTYDIFNLYEFDKRVRADDARGLCRGAPQEVAYAAGRPQLRAALLRYVMSQLGGLALSWYMYTMPLQDEFEAGLDRGFDFIEQKAPREAQGLDVLRWITKFTHKQCVNSPICGWKDSLVEKAIRGLQQQGVLAKVRKYLPLSLKSLDPAMLRFILGPLLPSLRTTSIVFLGENGIGKSPVAEILALALARYWINKHGVDRDPTVRIAPDMDFFRGDPGNPYTPFIFDDGDVASVEMRKLKSFLEVGEEESMTRERWGASKFVRNQWRCLCDTVYCWEAMPDIAADLDTPGSHASLSMAQFLDLISPAFGKTGLPNIMALLKKAHIVVNTNSHIVVKQAKQEQVKVRPPQWMARPRPCRRSHLAPHGVRSRPPPRRRCHSVPPALRPHRWVLLPDHRISP